VFRERPPQRCWDWAWVSVGALGVVRMTWQQWEQMDSVGLPRRGMKSLSAGISLSGSNWIGLDWLAAAVPLVRGWTGGWGCLLGVGDDGDAGAKEVDEVGDVVVEDYAGEDVLGCVFGQRIGDEVGVGGWEIG
jgi:hypothetical protein